MDENNTMEEYAEEYADRLEENQDDLNTESMDNSWKGKNADFCWIDGSHFHGEDKYYSVIYFTKINNQAVTGGVCGDFSQDEIVRFLAIQIMDNLIIKNKNTKQERKNERLLSNNSSRFWF